MVRKLLLELTSPGSSFFSYELEITCPFEFQHLLGTLQRRSILLDAQRDVFVPPVSLLESYFSTLPIEVALDLLSLLDKRAITQFASVSKNQKKYFEKQDGLWKQLVCRLYHWGPKELSKVKSASQIDWKKEFRVSAYYHDKIRFNQIYADPSQTQFNLFSVVDEAHLRYKYNQTVQAEELLFFYFNIQSKSPLYPLPIGNFSVAYYEVQILDDCSEPGYIYVGGALDGFVNGLPGVGRNSFSYGASDGRIVLENDFGVSTAPSCTTGDIVGFGINFHNLSLFFTKNGKIVAEATKNTQDTPIFNLKALHATIGFAGVKECKINLGAAPFAFDVLHYQQEKSKTKLYVPTKLYSDVLREHLVVFSESESFDLPEGLPYSYAPMDYNPPPPEAKINPFLYMVLYMRLPPNFVPPKDMEDISIIDNTLKAMAHFRAILNAQPMLTKIEKDEVARQALDYIAACLEVDMINEKEEGKTYEDYLNDVSHAAVLNLSNILRTLIGITLDDLLKDVSRFYVHVLLCYVILGGFDHQHFLSQLSARAFYKMDNAVAQPKKFTNQQVQDAINMSVWKLLGLRRTSILLAAGETIKYRNQPQKEKDRAEALRVYGKDKLIESLFDMAFKQMGQAMTLVPEVYEADILTVIAEAKAGATDRALAYGIFAFELRPDQYTEAELTNEVMQRLDAVVTDELKLNYLQQTLVDWDIKPPMAYASIAAVMERIFGYKPTKQASPEQAVNELHTYIEGRLRKIERKIKRKKLAAGQAATAQNKTSTVLVVGASVAVATIALVSALFFMRKKSK